MNQEEKDFQQKVLVFLLSWRASNEAALPGSMARELTAALCSFVQQKEEKPNGND